MINIKTKLILPIVGLTITGIIVFGTFNVYAQAQSGKTSGIVQKLAQKFGLKESDVQAVFDQTRIEQKTQMQQKFEDNLTQLVKDGKLTEDQKQLILTKRQELQNLRAQKPNDWQTQKQNLADWAKQNNIDEKYLFGGFAKHSRDWKGK